MSTQNASFKHTLARQLLDRHLLDSVSNRITCSQLRQLYVRVCESPGLGEAAIEGVASVAALMEQQLAAPEGQLLRPVVLPILLLKSPLQDVHCIFLACPRGR